MNKLILEGILIFGGIAVWIGYAIYLEVNHNRFMKKFRELDEKMKNK